MSTPVLVIFLAGYLLLCAYVCMRGAQALRAHRLLLVCWLACVPVLCGGFFAGIALGETRVLGFFPGHWLRGIGVTWLVTLPYWVIAAVFWDVLRFAGKRWHFFPSRAGGRCARAGLFAFAGTIVVVACVFGVGYLNFLHPQTTVLRVKIDKPPGGARAGPGKTLRIAAASDLHLGDIIGSRHLKEYVGRINALEPDIILLLGDIIDRNVSSLENRNMGVEFEKLRARLGVYAVVGNHEGFMNVRRSIDFFEKHGVRVLHDEVRLLDNGAFYLAGRADNRRGRKTLGELLAGVERARPLILMEHQPRNLGDSAAAGVDLQLSGHTHAGQIWPVTWLVRFFHEVSYGYARKGDFQIYVTSGLGLWGFPARIGSKSEIVDITVEFAE